ncbi:MAG: c-type cytochrome [Cytophagaceae bacterium]
MKDHHSSKVSKNDPFAKSMVESQFFDIDAKEDRVVEGKNGTVVILPKGCFKDSQGNVVEGDITLEIAEADHLEDLLLSNLTTTSEGKLLESGGILYVNATRDGEKLTINPENPIYIEILNKEGKKDMMFYKGVRDGKGATDWKAPKPLAKYLIAVELNSLNFFPEGFEIEVEQGMPYRSYKVATDKLKDSLYYSLTSCIDTRNELIASQLTDSSIVPPCGIDPASIKVLRNKKFEGSLIATREFERRLREIFKTCDQSILGIYVNNMDKNLWELDSMAAVKLGYGHPQFEVFSDFYKEKLTKVKKADRRAEALKIFYSRKIIEVREQLQKLKIEAEQQIEKDNEKARQKESEYRALLVKRQEYRMEKFGFEMTDTGWVHVARKIKVEQLEKFELSVEVEDGSDFDRVHVYIVNPWIKSLFALISIDNVYFNYAYVEDGILLMKMGQDFNVVVVAYKDGKPYYINKFFNLKKMNKIQIKRPQVVSMSQLKIKIKGGYFNYSQENKIWIDLEYQAAFEREEQRQKRLLQESVFISRLKRKAFNCAGSRDGETIFLAQCITCHEVNHEKVGPALGCIGQRRTLRWFSDFTNSPAVFITIDKEAKELAKKYAPTIMPNHHLSDEEMKALYDYLNEYCQE